MGTLYVTGATTCNSSLNVSGNTTLNNNITCNSSLSVTGNITCISTLNVSGQTNLGPGEDIAELANVLAWDAVGAQIEPYLVQHAEWQRPCGVALGCRSLNSRGIKMLRRAAVF